ncbi:hypothetical protein [Yersinia massiliensis]|uniref:hypothetical protein n=1 Tax=Yersinia massiliensis TaxID=419257 RepID=UPI000C148E98|nr:hypothetical protein [Yersinia massiliensis]PHZ25558.1 hypothetical protein CS535_02740 [Yersinia massiliensis]
MDRISYPISNIDISHTVQAMETKGVTHDKAHFYIDGYNIAEHDNISKMLEQLVHKGWLNSPSDFNECERRVNLLSLISEFSMADVVLEYSDKTHLHLDHDPHISMEFKRNDDSALEMVYSATYSDVEGEVFTLNCKMLLGDDFTLNENKARVYFEFNENCSTELRNDLDCRTVIERIFDWFKNKFSSSSYIADNTVSFKVSGSPDIQHLPFAGLSDNDFNELFSNEKEEGELSKNNSLKTNMAMYYKTDIDDENKFITDEKGYEWETIGTQLDTIDGVGKTTVSVDIVIDEINNLSNEDCEQLSEELGAVNVWDRSNGYQYATVPIADIDNSE